MDKKFLGLLLLRVGLFPICTVGPRGFMCQGSPASPETCRLSLGRPRLFGLGTLPTHLRSPGGSFWDLPRGQGSTLPSPEATHEIVSRAKRGSWAGNLVVQASPQC